MLATAVAIVTCALYSTSNSERLPSWRPVLGHVVLLPDEATSGVDMKREPIASSMMASAGYDALTRTLEIEFVQGGTYLYLDVPHTEHAALLAAPSKGRFFHTRINRVFTHRRVDRS